MKPNYIYSLLVVLNVLTIIGAWLLLNSQARDHQLELLQQEQKEDQTGEMVSKLEPRLVQAELGQPKAEPIKLEPDVEVVARPKVPQIPIYSKGDGAGKVFTTFRGRKDLIVSEYEGEWAKTVSSQGFPVWVRQDMVENFSKGYVRVIVNRANARTFPSVKDSVPLGKLAAGDILKINRTQGDWVRVWSPLKFRAWVKISDLGDTV